MATTTFNEGGTTYTINFLYNTPSVGEIDIRMSPNPTAARANDWTLHIGTDTLAFSSATRGSDYFRWTDTTNFGTSSTPFTDGAVLAAKITTTNVAPTVANVIPDQEAMGGMAFNYVVPANTFSDGDSDTLTYMATKADGAALPTWLSFDAGTSTFSGMPQDADVGTVSVKVTANDGNGGSVSDEFDITVVDTTPPTLTSATVVYKRRTIDLVFSEAYAIPADEREATQFANTLAGHFSVTAGGNAATVTLIASQLQYRTRRITLGVSPTIGQGQAVVVTYTDPTAGDDAVAIEDAAGNETATFTTGRNGVPVVTNNSTVDTTPPTLTRAIVNEAGQLSSSSSQRTWTDPTGPLPPPSRSRPTAATSRSPTSFLPNRAALRCFRIVGFACHPPGPGRRCRLRRPHGRQRH